MTGVVELSQHSAEVVSLFNNMKLPATIIAGAIVPLGLLNPLPLRNPDGEKEGKITVAMRQLYSIAAIISLTCELSSVMYATVAVNKLIETNVAPASSVWDLIQRDYNLPWAATNANFVLGMYSFMFMIGCRVYVQAGQGLLGRGLAGLAFSGLMLMVSVVNRGVASGSGDGLSYGGNVAHLIGNYFILLVRQATRKGQRGLLEIFSIAGLAYFSLDIVRGVCKRVANDGVEETS